MKFNCARIQTALANNEPLRMPIRINDELAQHLSECADCAALLDARQGVKAALQSALANDDAAPVALRARIRRELSQPQNRWHRALSWFDGLNKSWMLATAAATLMALFQSRTYNSYYC